MGRLTEHMDYCFMACYEQEGDKIREECPIYKCCYSRQMHEKLSHYEDLEEQGRLIELPCKVGEIIYEIHNNEIRTNRLVTKWKIARYLEEGFFDELVFTTKEEAEAKLQELKEGAK
jgi:hypothetical protein